MKNPDEQKKNRIGRTAKNTKRANSKNRAEQLHKIITTVANIIALMKREKTLRVHDLKEEKEAVMVFEKMRERAYNPLI